MVTTTTVEGGVEILKSFGLNIFYLYFHFKTSAQYNGIRTEATKLIMFFSIIQ